jgi:thiol-disulfide isomerase/thioredoxin
MKQLNQSTAERQTPKLRIAMSSYALALGVSVVVLFGAVAVSGQDKSLKKEIPKLLSVGEVAPDWTLNDSAGKPRTLSEFRGKVVVMDFWATWCGPCKEVMPRMQKLYEKYQDRDVVILGVDAWEQKDALAFMQQKKFGYSLLLKGEDIAESYRVTILPSVYVVGVDGRVIYSHVGVDHKDLNDLIEKHLKEKSASRAGIQ